MIGVPLLQRLREHQLWANHRLLDACQALSIEQLHRPFEMGQGSPLATITHLYAAEFAWLAALEGNPEPISPFDIKFKSLEALANAWADLERRWATFYATLTDDDLSRPVAKRSTSSGEGKIWVTPLSDVLLHIATHAQYTAAQLKNMLRHLGVTELPDVMLITMSRSAAL